MKSNLPYVWDGTITAAVLWCLQKYPDRAFNVRALVEDISWTYSPDHDHYIGELDTDAVRSAFRNLKRRGLVQRDGEEPGWYAITELGKRAQILRQGE